MNTQQLICFVCVADRLNFTKAAEELFLSTPTVTHHIKSLETELNTVLFIRNSKMVQLTEAGKEFYGDAKEILARISLAEKKISSIASRNTFFLNIGCTSNAELEYMKGPISRMCEEYPDICPHIHIHDYSTMKKMFDSDQVDILFSTSDMVRNVTGAVFKKTKKAINYAVFRKDSPLSHKDEIFFEDLKNERLITLHPKFTPFHYPNDLRNKIAEHMLYHLDIPCDNDQAGLMMAECGYGVVVFPEFCIGTLSEGLEKRPFEKDSFSMDYGIVRHKNIKHRCIKFFMDSFV